MRVDSHIVLIDNGIWMAYGFRMLRWIKLNISDECYGLRFTKPGDPVSIVFDDPLQAVLFRLVVGGSRDLLADRLSNAQ